MFDWFKRLFGGGGSDGYRRLLRAANGDVARAERLIAYELKRDPTLSREAAIRSALDRLEYERSR
jgi:hypothetical protein